MESPLETASLQQHKLFQGIEPDTLSGFLDCLRRQPFNASETIIREGEVGDRLYLIESGRCEVLKRVYTKEAIGEQCLAVLHPGETFGEMELLDGQPRSATIRGVEAGVLLSLAESDLLAKTDSDYRTFSRMLINIAREVSLRLRLTDRWLAGSLFSSKLPVQNQTG